MISLPVIVAAIGAVAGLLAHQVVTPVADPKDGNGNPLVPLPLLPVAAPPASGAVRVIPPPPDAPPPGG